MIERFLARVGTFGAISILVVAVLLIGFGGGVVEHFRLTSNQEQQGDSQQGGQGNSGSQQEDQAGAQGESKQGEQGKSRSQQEDQAGTQGQSQEGESSSSGARQGQS